MATTLPDNYIVYFAKCVDKASDVYGLVKIGCTTNRWSKRRAAIQRQYGEVELLGWLGGYLDAEAELHKRFARYRTVDEWFELERPLIQFLRTVNTYPPPSTAGYNKAAEKQQELEDLAELKVAEAKLANLERQLHEVVRETNVAYGKLEYAQKLRDDLNEEKTLLIKQVALLEFGVPYEYLLS